MRNIIIAVILIAAAANFFIAKSNSIDRPPLKTFNDTLKVLAPEKIHPEEEKLISTILTRYHYNKTSFNDSLSAVTLNKYLNALDPNKSYFLDSDIEEFKKDQYNYDDYLEDGILEPAYNIYNTYYRRIISRLDYGIKLLDNEMDFKSNETYLIDRDNAAYPKTEQEANDLWRKKVTNDALSLKIAGKDWKSIKETLTKRYINLRRIFTQFNSEDVFQIIMNAYTETVDPHTNYLSPKTSADFKIDMSLSLEGIGAQLQQDDEYVKVAEVVAGGPCFKSNLIKKNDRIVGVAQGDNGEMVDVIGWRITDVVQLIRGPKGTVVRLQILKAEDGANAVPKEIKLVRDKIKLEDQASKQKVIEIENNGKKHKIGVITIPVFYSDFEGLQRGDKDYKSTTADVKKLITQLKGQNVEGIIIDLRNNGGGALNEAINLTGLFIKDGPVVQVKNSNGAVDEDNDEDQAIYYDGPLTVLVNKFSASASEIFAGAIQDYGRGLILGEQTYGKGTVQNIIDLNRMLPEDKDKTGQMKLTIAKFYRVTGNSTQRKGVIPDIKFPSYFDDSKDFGESSESSALPYDQIKPSNFIKYGSFNNVLSELIKLHDERIKKDYDWDVYVNDVNDFKQGLKKKEVSLNYDVRKKEKDDEDNKKALRDSEKKKMQGLKVVEKGEIKKEVKEEDKTDVLLKESGNIIVDYIKLAKR